MNKNKLNKNYKNELIKNIPSPHPNISYAAVVVNNSNNKLYELISLLKPQGHPDTAATVTFLAQKHSSLGTKLPHKQSGVLCGNNTIGGAPTLYGQFA